MADEPKPSDEAPSPQTSSPEAPSPEAPAPRAVNPRANVWIVVAIVVVAGLFLALSRRRSASQQVRRPIAAADGGGVPVPEAPTGSPVLAILAPLQAGATLADGQVESISQVVDGKILVKLRRGQSEGTYGIMLATPASSNLLQAGRYVVYVHGTHNPAFGDMAMALTAVLRRHQSEPAPEGLRPFAFSPR